MTNVLQQINEIVETTDIAELTEKLMSGQWIAFRAVSNATGARFVLGRVADYSTRPSE